MYLSKPYFYPRMNARKLVYGTLITAYTAVLSIGGYALVWEQQQPKQQIKQAKIVSIKQNTYINDLHWSSRSLTVQVDKEQRPIKFHANKWDPSVKVGDTIDAVVRPSFTIAGLQEKLTGLEVKK